MFPFVRSKYQGLSVDDRKELCSAAYRIWSGCKDWTNATKASVLGTMQTVTAKHKFIEEDTYQIVQTLRSSNPVLECPIIDLQVLMHYFAQFFVIKDRKLYLPVIRESSRVVPDRSTTPDTNNTGSSRPKIKAVTEETWWVIRVKNSYRMCRLTLDRGEYWEMVEYDDNGKVKNAQYRFPKYDNRVVYEYKEHITPNMFESKIKEAVEIRKEALRKQAMAMLERYSTVLIARHLTGGTLAAGIVDEDDTYWYLDAYTEKGDPVFIGDNRWELEKRSRCTVVEVLRRK